MYHPRVALLGAHLLPQLGEARAALRDLDEKMVPGARLWSREWGATSVRGNLGALDQLKTMLATDDRRDVVRRKQQLEEADRLIAGFSALRERLLEIDRAEFGPLQDKLRARTYTPEDLKRDLAARPIYERDVFTRKLLGIDWHPDRETEQGREHVFYEASSVSATLDVLDRVGPDDVLYDLGSGCGIVLLLASWMTEARAIKGVEYEPAYCRMTLERVRDLGFDRIEVINADAKNVDYGDGTIFYFFHPFEGEILEAVLAKLRAIAAERTITICARGACKHWFVELPWMEMTSDHPSGVRVFKTRAAG